MPVLSGGDKIAGDESMWGGNNDANTTITFRFTLIATGVIRIDILPF